MTVRLGDDAPDFTAETTQGTINFLDWKGDSWAILFSHPKDFTPVCTTELGYMAKIEPEFTRRNAKLIGLSVDPVGNHEKWAKDIEDYENGQPASVPSSVEEAAIGIAAKLDMSRPQIRRDLLQEKSTTFGRSPLYNRVFELAEKGGKPLARQALPQIDLKSPKISRKLTTEWFARKVEGRYRACVGRGSFK